MPVKFSNNAATTLSSAITAEATSVAVVDGSVFPSISNDEYFYASLEDIDGGIEIVKVTSVNSNLLTVIRGVENTTPRSFISGDKAQNRLTAGGLNDITKSNSGRRNVLINGAFTISQRGDFTSATDFSDNEYTVDRWVANQALNLQKFEGQIVGSVRTNYVKCLYSNSSNMSFGQKVENKNFDHMLGQTVTLSAWVKTNNSNFGLRVRDHSDGNQVFGPRFIADEQWHKVEWTFTFRSDADVMFIMFDAYLNGSWVAAVSGDYINIALVQLELGNVATPFEQRSYGEELALCQRYCYKTGDVGTANEWYPNSQTNAASGSAIAIPLSTDRSKAAAPLRFPVAMRAAPSVNFYSASATGSTQSGNISSYTGGKTLATTTQPTGSVTGLVGCFGGVNDAILTPRTTLDSSVTYYEDNRRSNNAYHLASISTYHTPSTPFDTMVLAKAIGINPGDRLRLSIYRGSIGDDPTTTADDNEAIPDLTDSASMAGRLNRRDLLGYADVWFNDHEADNSTFTNIQFDFGQEFSNAADSLGSTYTVVLDQFNSVNIGVQVSYVFCNDRSHVSNFTTPTDQGAVLGMTTGTIYDQGGAGNTYWIDCVPQNASATEENLTHHYHRKVTTFFIFSNNYPHYDLPMPLTCHKNEANSDAFSFQMVAEAEL